MDVFFELIHKYLLHANLFCWIWKAKFEPEHGFVYFRPISSFSIAVIQIEALEKGKE